MAQTIFYLAAALAVLAIGAGVGYAMWQLAATLKHVRQVMLPQVELTLIEVQKNLDHIDTLTQGVDATVGEANQLVASANKTVQSVGTGVQSFNKNVAVPFLIRTRSVLEGVKAGVNRMRTRPNPPQLVVVHDPELVNVPAGVEAGNLI